MYRIGINVSFLRKPYTGIGQVALYTLRELFSRDELVIRGKRIPAQNISFFLYSDEPISLAKMPFDENRVFFRPLTCFGYRRDDLFRQYLYERIAIPWATRRDRLNTFVSLSQSATIFPFFSRVRHTMMVHDIIPEVMPEYQNTWRKRFVWKSVKRGIRKARTIIAVSRHTEKDIIRRLGIPASRIRVCPIDVDPSFSHPVSQERQKHVLEKYDLRKGYIYIAGGLEMRKNVTSSIHAYTQVLRDISNKEDFPDLVISGRHLPQLAPLLTNVETLAKKLNITQKTHILGIIPQKDAPVLYSGASMILYPSIYEGFGMPVLEAMRIGTPVITTKKTSLPEVAGDAACYCDGTPQDIARAIQELLNSEYVRSEMKRRGVERSRLFSWKRFVDALLPTL
jgi:glycosyltransferase involved in cell wall biosynthesis